MFANLLLSVAQAESAGYSYSYNSSGTIYSLFTMVAPLVIISVLSGILCYFIAEKRGHKGYFWCGFFLWIIGVIYVAALPVRQEESAAELSAEDRKLIADFHRLSKEDQKMILSNLHSLLKTE